MYLQCVFIKMVLAIIFNSIMHYEGKNQVEARPKFQNHAMGETWLSEFNPQDSSPSQNMLTEANIIYDDTVIQMPKFKKRKVKKKSKTKKRKKEAVKKLTSDENNLEEPKPKKKSNKRKKKDSRRFVKTTVTERVQSNMSDSKEEGKKNVPVDIVVHIKMNE